MDTEKKEKIGFVFEGGGIRGNFINGVIDALLDENIKADYIAGSSAGIGNGVNYATAQRGRGLEIVENYIKDKRYMGKKYLFQKGNRSYFNIHFVFKEMPETFVPLDFDALENFDGEIEACVTRVKTGMAEYMSVKNREDSWKTILASCSLPLFFQPVNLNGKWYMDGGLSHPVPLQGAIDHGCTKIVAVLTRERTFMRTKDSYMELCARMYRKNEAFAECCSTRLERYAIQRQEIFSMEQEGKLFVIEPENTAGFSKVESDVEKIRALYQQGYDRTMASMGALKGYLFS